MFANRSEFIIHDYIFTEHDDAYIGWPTVRSASFAMRHPADSAENSGPTQRVTNRLVNVLRYD